MLLGYHLIISFVTESISLDNSAIQEKIENALKTPFYLRQNSLKRHGVARKRSGFAPNLFSLSSAQDSNSVKSCSQAFDLFYNQSFANLIPLPQRLSRQLEGNESDTKNWAFFFNPGKEGTEGYETCFQDNVENIREKGQGPCAAAFHGQQCEFFPDFPIGLKFHPACCDKTGCTCECIFQCATKDHVKTLIESSLADSDFLKCTRDVESVEQAEDWKETACQKECSKREKISCRMEGGCIKNVCKFCVKDELCKNASNQTESQMKLENKKDNVSTVEEGKDALKKSLIEQMKRAWAKLSLLDDL